MLQYQSILSQQPYQLLAEVEPGSHADGVHPDAIPVR